MVNAGLTPTNDATVRVPWRDASCHYCWAEHGAALHTLMEHPSLPAAALLLQVHPRAAAVLAWRGPCGLSPPAMLGGCLCLVAPAPSAWAAECWLAAHSAERVSLTNSCRLQGGLPRSGCAERQELLWRCLQVG